MNRIFISYRSSDGKKDAARLAADLNERFGEQLVFYDKQDLLGGTSWRDAINNTLGSQPVVLVLVTPDLLGAVHPGGGRRIDHEDDPIRGELLTAHSSGAVILPLLTDGTPMPASHQLPAPLHFFSEAHARTLRTDDWNADLQRIMDDLKAHRITPTAAGTPAIQPLMASAAQAMVQRVKRWLMYLGAVMVALLVIGMLLPEDDTPTASKADATAQTGNTGDPPAAPAESSSAPAVPAKPTTGHADIAGVWWAVDEKDHRTRVQITIYGSDAVLQTDAIPVAWYPKWQAYAERLRTQGIVFSQIRYGGSGQWASGRLQVQYDVHSTEGHGPLDTGNLTLALSADGRELSGQFWSNGEQSHTPLRLLRRP